MTIRRGAVPALLAGVLVAVATVASGGLLALLAALPPLLIAFSLFLGRSAGVDALLELAEAIRARPTRATASALAPVLNFDYLPLSARPLLGGAARRGPPLAGISANALA